MHQALGSTYVIEFGRIVQCIIVSICRESHIFQCEWFLGWCRMGDPGRACMSAVPKSNRRCNCQSLFHYNVPVVSACAVVYQPTPGAVPDYAIKGMATTSAAEAN